MGKKRIEIVYGNEYRLHEIPTENQEADLFYECYQKAKSSVQEIVKRNTGLLDLVKFGANTISNTDFLNNIIAFCGERGQGKTSAVMNFTNLICNKTDWVKLGQEETGARKEYSFTKLDLIDPSMFDDKHNILDVILAQMFRKYTEMENQNNSPSFNDKKRRIIKTFQKVYKQVSIIAGEDKAFEQQFDYEGNMEKLDCLAASTNLKADFYQLIMDFMDVCGCGENQNPFLIIQIDDLDMNIRQAYQMAEQIRKYLILPNVIIVMAVRIPQLELCIQNENMMTLEKMISLQDEFVKRQIRAEVKQMANRYLDKLIPYERRIQLPVIREIASYDLTNTNIGVKDQFGKKVTFFDEKTELDIPDGIYKLIYYRTNICFLPKKGCEHYLFPVTMREFIHLVLVLCNMKNIILTTGTEDEKTLAEIKKKNMEAYEYNLNAFEHYFTSFWINENISNSEERAELLSVSNKITNNVLPYFNEILKKKFRLTNNITSLGDLVTLLNMENIQNEEYLYAINVIYTLKLKKVMLLEKYDNDKESVLGASIFGNSYSGFYRKGELRSVTTLMTSDLIDIIGQNLVGIDGIKMNELLNQVLGEERNKAQFSTLQGEDNKYIQKILCILEILQSGDLNEPLRTGNNKLRQSTTISIDALMTNLLKEKRVYIQSGLENFNITYELFKENIKDFENLFNNVQMICNSMDTLLETVEYALDNRNPHDKVENWDLYVLVNIFSGLDINEYMENVYQLKMIKCDELIRQLGYVFNRVKKYSIFSTSKRDKDLNDWIEAKESKTSFEQYLFTINATEYDKSVKSYVTDKGAIKAKIIDDVKGIINNLSLYQKVFGYISMDYNFEELLQLGIDVKNSQEQKNWNNDRVRYRAVFEQYSKIITNDIKNKLMEINFSNDATQDNKLEQLQEPETESVQIDTTDANETK